MRLKRDIDSIKPNAGGAGASAANATENSDELRREVALLKGRVQTLEKELMNAEIELRAAKKELKEKAGDNSVSVALNFIQIRFVLNILFLKQAKQIADLSVEYNKHLSEMCNLQKEMDKLLHSST